MHQLFCFSPSFFFFRAMTLQTSSASMFSTMETPSCSIWNHVFMEAWKRKKKKTTQKLHLFEKHEIAKPAPLSELNHFSHEQQTISQHSLEKWSVWPQTSRMLGCSRRVNHFNQIYHTKHPYITHRLKGLNLKINLTESSYVVRTQFWTRCRKLSLLVCIFSTWRSGVHWARRAPRSWQKPRSK